MKTTRRPEFSAYITDGAFRADGCIEEERTFVTSCSRIAAAVLGGLLGGDAARFEMGVAMDLLALRGVAPGSSDIAHAKACGYGRGLAGKAKMLRRMADARYDDVQAARGA